MQYVKACVVIWACVTFLGSGHPTRAQEGGLAPEDKTQGRPNGRIWERLDRQTKIFFLYGIESGLALGADWTGNEKTYKQLSIKGFKFGDLAQEIDAFYSERSNIRVPIAFAYVFVIRKMNGATRAELDDYSSELRKMWNR